MLNNRLGTQPLDPNILLQLEQKNATQKVAKTQPLTAPGDLLNPALLGDAFTQPPTNNGSVPAQSGPVSEALKPKEMKPLSAAIAAPQLGTGNGNNLSDAEATLLLELSATLGDMRHQSPINFSQAVSALQKLNLSGSAGFETLSNTQKQILSNLGITPENSANILQKLYQVILPDSTGGGSDSFKQAKSSVSSFLSGLNLREEAMSVIRKAEDLNQVAQLVDGLSAGGISSLLADKVIVVNDLAVGEINNQNFQISSPMDFTVGQVFVNAQKAPEKLDGVTDILQKVKQSEPLNRQETLLLGEYGLFVNKDSQLQTMNADGPLPEQSIAQLEQMLTTVKSSTNTDMYNQVIGQSIQLLESSQAYMALSEQARAMALRLADDADKVAQDTVRLNQERQQANILQVKLDQAQTQAQDLVDANAVVDAIDSGSLADGGPMTIGSAMHNSGTPVFGAMGIGTPPIAGAPPSASPFEKPDLNPREIAAVFAKVGINVREGNDGFQFFLNGQQLSRDQVKTYVQQALTQVSQDIGQTTDALKTQQVKVEATRQDVETGQDRLRLQQQELDAIEQQLKSAEAQYTKDVKAYQEIRDQARLELPPDELEQLNTILDPMVQRVATEAFMHRAQTQVIIDAAEKHARQIMDEANAELAALAKDQQQWANSIQAAEELLLDLQPLLESASRPRSTPATDEETAPPVETQPDRVRRSGGYNPFERPAKSGTAPLNPAWLDRHNAELSQKSQAQAKAQARNERSYFESLQNEKRFNADMQRSRDAIAAQRVEENKRRNAESI